MLLWAIFWGMFLVHSGDVFAQYHLADLSASAGIIGQTRGDFLGGLELRYAYQPSRRHAFGGKLALHTFKMNEVRRQESYPQYTGYGVDFTYQDKPFGTFGLFYRFHFSEGSYFESGISNGRFREFFSAYRDGSAITHGVAFSSKYRYPLLKWDNLFGFQTSKAGAQAVWRFGLSYMRLFPTYDHYLTVAGSETLTYAFTPTRGNFFFLTMSLGFGIKK
jgi:hypothetical protein